MTILLSDSPVTAIPVHETSEPLVRLDGSFGPDRALVRRLLAALYGPVDVSAVAA